MLCLAFPQHPNSEIFRTLVSDKLWNRKGEKEGSGSFSAQTLARNPVGSACKGLSELSHSHWPYSHPDPN